MFYLFPLTLLLVCFAGCVSNAGRLSPALPPDPPVAYPVYTQQAIHLAKPSALEFWIQSPTRHTYPWNIIRMWFPERLEMYDDSGNEIYALSMPHDPAGWEYTKTGMRAECDLTVGGKLTRIIERKDQTTLLLTVNLKNASQKTWNKTSFHSCLQLSAAGDYEDNFGDRTYWVLDGQLFPTAQMAITDPGMRGSKAIGEKIEMKDGSVKTLTEGVAFVTSKDNKYVIGYSWQPAEALFYNRANIVACIHVQPPPLTIEPGQSKTLKGIIFIVEDSLEEACKQYRQWKNDLQK